VPFDERSAVVPNEEGRVTGPDGKPLPGEYVAGWLKRGPTGVIGTNKSDAAQTVRALLADLAGGPGPSDAPLPRAGLLRLPAAGTGTEAGPSRFAALLAGRGQVTVSYEDWLRIESAERELAASLGRGARVKLASRDEIHRACGLS
jgi:ferredoxin/flavodoxin---NADP+ reductase